MVDIVSIGLICGGGIVGEIRRERGKGEGGAPYHAVQLVTCFYSGEVASTLRGGKFDC